MSMADRLRRWQLSSPVSVLNIWWSAANIDHTHRRQMYVSARPSRRNCLITIWCGSVSDMRRHLWESLREWLLVPPKSPSSRGLSVIAELLISHVTTALQAEKCSKFLTSTFDTNAMAFVSYDDLKILTLTLTFDLDRDLELATSKQQSVLYLHQCLNCLKTGGGLTGTVRYWYRQDHQLRYFTGSDLTTGDATPMTPPRQFKPDLHYAWTFFDRFQTVVIRHGKSVQTHRRLPAGPADVGR